MGVSSTYFYCDVGIEDGNSSCHHFVVSPFLKVVGAAEYLLDNDDEEETLCRV